MPPALPQQGPQTNQAPNPVTAATAVAAVAVRTDTRMAAAQSGGSGGSSEAKGKRGRETDQGARTTEARTDRAQAKPRGMGNKADLSV